MMFTNDQIKLLEAKLQPENIAQRDSGKMKLSYLEGWFVNEEANRVFGFDGWDTETLEMKLTADTLKKDSYGNEKHNVGYIAKVRITIRNEDGTQVVREGWGAGTQIDADLGKAHEGASKEAETDAFKRAMKTFGNVFGLALYDKDRAGVDAPQKSKPVKQQTETQHYKEIGNGIYLELEQATTAKEISDVLSRNDEKITAMPNNWQVWVQTIVEQRQDKIK